MPAYKKGHKAWNAGVPGSAGPKGYPEEVKRGKITKKEFKTRLISENIHNIGPKATRMLDKAIREGLKNNSDFNDLSNEIYRQLVSDGWAKEKLARVYKLLEKCNNMARQELAVKASSFVVDKLVPDKIEPRRVEAAQSAEELRKTLFGFLKGLGKGGKARAAFVVETDGQRTQGFAGDRGHPQPKGIESAGNGTGRLEVAPPDRLLRTGGESAGGVPQEPEKAPGAVRSEQNGENDHNNRG